MSRTKNDGKGRLGGRTAGTPNKVTGEAKQILADIVNGRADTLKEKLDLIVDPKDYITLYLKICEFVIPKKAAVNITESAKLNDLKQELKELASKEIKEI